eukprot:TRINITY_DN19771_c0_g1_i2.p1 TRINITY_DN19771_c0_g1~~TRINITY_DN19771_c0_g1_i2.p1  ORF type:complete len:429 (+),score=54.11 TRINITY_DN19771_c0_g1_i2:135-1421(+)
MRLRLEAAVGPPRVARRLAQVLLVLSASGTAAADAFAEDAAVGADVCEVTATATKSAVLLQSNAARWQIDSSHAPVDVLAVGATDGKMAKAAPRVLQGYVGGGAGAHLQLKKSNAARVEPDQLMDPVIHDVMDKAVKREINNSVANKTAADVVDAATQDVLNNPRVERAMERDVEDALSRAVANEVINQHRLPTQREMEDTVEDEIHSIWDSLQAARRYEFNQTRYELSDRHGSFTAFFSSARWLSWMLLAATTACSVLVYRLVALDLPTSTEYHAAALFGWFTLAGLYALAMHALREDPAAMTMWTVGYLLELMFSLENVFVFHVIVKVDWSSTFSSFWSCSKSRSRWSSTWAWRHGCGPCKCFHTFSAYGSSTLAIWQPSRTTLQTRAVRSSVACACFLGASVRRLLARRRLRNRRIASLLTRTGS